MDARTIGQLITGFGAKLIVVIVALYAAHEAIVYISELFARIEGAFA